MSSSAASQSSRGGSHPSERGPPSRDSSRRRRRSPVDQDDDDQQAPVPKRRNIIVIQPKRKTADEYGIAARLITRIHASNWEPCFVINAGISLLALEEDDEDAVRVEVASASGKKRLLYNIFELLCDRIPGFSDSTDWDSVRSRLDKGKCAARTEDNHTLKTEMPKWKNCKWDPPLNPDTKHDRGLAHPQCAMLLAPISVDWEDEEERNKFLNQYDPPMTALQLWPAFMYEGFKGDTTKLAKGLLKSSIMVRAARAILFPPSVANAEDGPDHQSNRKTKADNYGMMGVTPGFLAYVAVGLRFALSSEKNFNNRGGAFDYERFYNDIIKYLNDAACKTQTSKLIEWWDSQLFKPKDTNVEEEPESMVALLRQQAEARQQNDE